MNVYRVVVRCVGEDAGKLVQEKRVILAQAETSDEAQKTAEEYAENSARFGPAWREFQWLESHTVTLPYEMRL